jgi:hypothetical protein
MDVRRGHKQTYAHFGSLYLRMINLMKYLFPCNVCIHLGFKKNQQNQEMPLGRKNYLINPKSISSYDKLRSDSNINNNGGLIISSRPFNLG